MAIATYVHGESFPTNYISPSNIQWNKSALPKDIETSKDLKKWYEAVGQVSISRWSYASLITDKNEQVILQGSGPSVGGNNFLVLTKQNGVWKKLIDIHGGFIFYQIPSNSVTLVVYQKSGAEYYRIQYQLKNGLFKKILSNEVPIELTRLDNSPINFYKFFWFLNMGTNE
jgi:hypothetical protein